MKTWLWYAYSCILPFNMMQSPPFSVLWILLMSGPFALERLRLPSCHTTFRCLFVCRSCTQSHKREVDGLTHLPPNSKVTSSSPVESPIWRGVSLWAATIFFFFFFHQWSSDVVGCLISLPLLREFESLLCDKHPCVWKKCHLIRERSIISGACNSLP